MQPPLSFGIELELCLATLPPHTAHPNPSESRRVRFPSAASAECAPAFADVVLHVVQTLSGAGMRVVEGEEDDEERAEDGDDGEGERPDEGSIEPGKDDALLHLPPRTDSFIRDPACRAQDGPACRDPTGESNRGPEHPGTSWSGIRSLPGRDCRLHPSHHDPYDLTRWSVGADSTIMVPVKRHAYSGYGLEIRSGAYYHSLSALAEISHALHVLTSTYLIAVNDTTGFHVHVGNGLAGFGFDTMRRLLAFLWAFEPQLSSLHSPHRFNAQWARSLRYGSVYSRDFLDAQGRRPRALEGVSHFLRVPDWDALHRDASAAGHSRRAYRFDDLVLFGMEGPQANKDGDLKLTVEFRAHAGSVDAQEITNYVKTVVGIVAFVRDADAGALNDLLSVVEYESFDEDGRTREPVLAETEFTVVDLLRRIGLWEPARYYQERGIYKIRREAEDDENIAPARTRSGCAAEGGWNRAGGTGERDAWEND